jgi:murein L,D-transpeptidase YcbB/YkuD
MKRILLLLAGFGAALGGCEEGSRPPPAPAFRAEPVTLDPAVASFYRDRGNRPVWVGRSGPRPEATYLAAVLAGAAAHGLDPERYGSSRLNAALAAAATGDTAARAQAELLLSRAYPAFVRDLRTAEPQKAVTYVDEGLAPEPPEARALLEAAAAAPDLRRHVAEATAMNPLYAALARGHARWLKANPNPAPAQVAVIRANLDRARAIPAHAGRYVIVDTASARLWMIDGRKVEGPMKAIVGKPAMATPQMAALIRHVVLNPWWNIPPDLARERAKRVLKSGTGFLARERIDVLSGWEESARVMPLAKVNWGAAASGRTALRMRQRPGGGNVMGAMKFMFPNHLGIYLHDFPDKSLFAREDRALSSGCVRVGDAPRLARWLFGGKAPQPQGDAPEQKVDLPRPVPVYITYLTVLPDPKLGLSFRPDPYKRERG